MHEARAAATGLALLSFLGAGYTHAEGERYETVSAGIYALMNLMRLDRTGGSFWDPQGRMYSHGIGAMALCEAYAMTGDERLRDASQAAINYICYAQDPRGGGWRYEPRQAGDTSVMGWQLAALKSGAMCSLTVPPLVVARASGYLNSVEYNGGADYSYTVRKLEPRPPLTAIGALCRMYIGMDRADPRIIAGAEALAARGPAAADCYYNYYAAQVLFHYTGGEGAVWERWNEPLREQLVRTQARQGHEAGSWAPGAGDHGTNGGGRLYATALSAMTLEVYYRMMPIYTRQAIDDSLETVRPADREADGEVPGDADR
jgi:hypothetical protein